MPEPSPTRTTLANELLRLRDLAGLSGREMGRRIGVSQPMMSRIGRGLTLPSLPVVRAWLEECTADPDVVARIVALTEDAHGEIRPWGALYADTSQLQGGVGARDADASLIRNFQPTVLPGLLQTAGYAQAVLGLGRSPDVSAAVRARLERQSLLYEGGRRFEFVIAEHVLRWPPAPGALQGQADRLASVSTLPSVEIRVLPDTVSAGVVPWHNFVLRSATDGVVTASAELMFGAQDDAGAGEMVALYEQTWSRLWDAAAQGEAALELIRRC